MNTHLGNAFTDGFAIAEISKCRASKAILSAEPRRTQHGGYEGAFKGYVPVRGSTTVPGFFFSHSA